MFILGAALVYYVMLPFVLWFSLSQQISTAGISIQLLPKVSDYLTLVTTLLLAFGLCFQLPVVVSLLGMAGIVSSKLLREGRRYAIVGVFIAAAILTPPDPISQMTLAIPMCLLYEISIWCVWLIERRKAKDEREADQGRGRGLSLILLPLREKCRRRLTDEGSLKAKSRAWSFDQSRLFVFQPLTRPRFAGHPSPAKERDGEMPLGVLAARDVQGLQLGLGRADRRRRRRRGSRRGCWIGRLADGFRRPAGCRR